MRTGSEEEATASDDFARHGSARTLLGLSWAIVCFCAVMAPLAVGSAHSTVRLVLAVLVLASAMLLLAGDTKRTHSANLLALLLTGLVGVEVLQLLPLPAAVLSKITPHAHEIFTFAGDSYPARAMTLDNAATLSGLNKSLLSLLFLLVVGAHARRRDRRRALLRLVFITAVVSALLGFLTSAVDEARVLLFYKPEWKWGAVTTGTFVNPNHFGAFMAMVAPIGVYFLLQPDRRVLSGLGYLTINLGLVLCGSRSALATGLLMQVVAVLGTRKVWPEQAKATRAPLIILAITALFAVLFVTGTRLWSDWTALGGELDRGNSKIGIWKAALPLLSQYTWTGVGKEAFQFAFTRLNPSGGNINYPYVENGYLQLLLDHGVLMGGSILVGLLYVAWRSWSSWTQSAASFYVCCGLASIALHEVFDFALEMPGVALPALVLAGLVIPTVRIPRLTSRRFLLAGVSVLLCCTLVLGSRIPNVDQDVRMLNSSAEEPISLEELRSRINMAISRHPADYLVWLAAGHLLFRQHEIDAIVFTNRALFLNPTSHKAHLLAAEILAVAGRKQQALLQYRTAITYTDDPRAEVLPVLAQRYPKISDILAAFPPRLEALQALAEWAVMNRDSEDTDTVLRTLVKRFPHHVPTLRLLAIRAIDAGRAAEARELAKRLQQLSHEPEDFTILVRERILATDFETAIRLVEDGALSAAEALQVKLSLARALCDRGEAKQTRLLLSSIPKHSIADGGSVDEILNNGHCFNNRGQAQGDASP